MEKKKKKKENVCIEFLFVYLLKYFNSVYKVGSRCSVKYMKSQKDF